MTLLTKIRKILREAEETKEKQEKAKKIVIGQNKSKLTMHPPLKEEVTNTFTHDGHEYNLSKLNALVKDNPEESIPLSKLTWIFKYDDPKKDHPEIIESARLSIPILVTMWKEKLTVLDGLHRIAKAQNEGIKDIKAKIVSKEQLDKVLKESIDHVLTQDELDKAVNFPEGVIGDPNARPALKDYAFQVLQLRRGDI